MNRHRNSQKRIYVENGIYFITTNTKDRYPYFENDILCELFVLQIEACKILHNAKIHGYKINPEHVHLLIQTGEQYSISDVMKSLKKQFSHNANKILKYEKQNLSDEWKENEIVNKINEFVKQNTNEINNIPLPKFQWQSSYHDHLIRDDRDLYFHLEYIRKQWIKHQLPENKWCHIINP